MLILEIVLALILIVLIYFMVDMVQGIKLWVAHEEELFDAYDKKLNELINTQYELKFSYNDIMGTLNNIRMLICYFSLLTTNTDDLLASISDEELDGYIQRYQDEVTKPEGYQVLLDEYIRRQKEKENDKND